MKFKRKYIILLFSLVIFAGYFLFTGKTENKFKSDKERSLSINLDHTFKHKETEKLSVRAFNLQKESKYEQAISLYKQALLIEPTNPILFFDISNCYLYTNKLNEALSSLDTAITLDSTNAIFYTNRGFIFWKLYKDQNSIRDYKKALQLDSTKWNIYSNLSIAYYTSKNEDEACKVFKIAKEKGLPETAVDDDKYLKIVQQLCK